MGSYFAPFAGWKDGDKICRDERERCRIAIESAQDITDSLIIVTSGKPPHGNRIHAEVIRDFVVDSGWPIERIVLAPKGRNTVLDMAAIFEAMVLDGRGEEVVLVSSWYHMLPRIPLIRLLFWVFVPETRRFKVRFRISWQAANPIRSFVRDLLAVGKSATETIWRSGEVSRNLRTYSFN